MNGSRALLIIILWLLMLVLVGVGIASERDAILAIGLIGYVAIPIGLIALAPLLAGIRLRR